MRQQSKRKHTSAKPTKSGGLPRWAILGLIAVVVVAIVAVIILGFFKPSSYTAKTYYMAEGTKMGNPAAPIKLYEYSDFQCSHCANFAENFAPAFIEKYINTDLVYYEYIPYPILGERSDAAALAAYCADDQGKFWAYHDILFQNQQKSSAPFSDANLVKYAKTIGLDTAKFQTCYTEQKFNTKLDENLKLGISKNVEGTPSFIINDGAPFYSNELDAKVEEALAKIK